MPYFEATSSAHCHCHDFEPTSGTAGILRKPRCGPSTGGFVIFEKKIFISKAGLVFIRVSKRLLAALKKTLQHGSHLQEIHTARALAGDSTELASVSSWAPRKKERGEGLGDKKMEKTHCSVGRVCVWGGGHQDDEKQSRKKMTKRKRQAAGETREKRVSN